MARKAGQLISRGPRTWLVRIFLGREPESRTRKYHNKIVRGSFLEAQSHLKTELQERGIGRLPRVTATSLNQIPGPMASPGSRAGLKPVGVFQFLSED